jgi:hypothetical protein
MELALVDDDRFRAAADDAASVTALPREQRAAGEAGFAMRFPEIATPGYAARDYNAFTVEQRALVQRLLLAGRLVLAATAPVGGHTALLTHAGVTRREIALLGLDDPRPETIAAALHRRLSEAVAAVAQAWRSGVLAPLSLAPLHVAGGDGEEGGGLLYHRPADPERPRADPAWEYAARAPRRYDPRAALPLGLVQVIGHTGHRKAASEMPRWVAPDTDHRPGGVRTLRVTPEGDVTYERAVLAPSLRDATVYMIDPEMHYVATPGDVAILDLG